MNNQDERDYIVRTVLDRNINEDKLIIEYLTTFTRYRKSAMIRELLLLGLKQKYADSAPQRDNKTATESQSKTNLQHMFDGDE